MSRLLFTACLLALSLPWQPALQGAVAAEKPNVILILADDIGIEGLGCYGGTSYQTPALDQLARDGLRFTQAYAQPLCTNTRVQLMTGLYNHRNWIAFGLLDPQALTIGHWMSSAGYQTCIAGKWQLQSYDPPTYPGAVQRRGRGMRVEDAGFHEYCLWHTGHTEMKGSRYANPVINQNGQFRRDLAGKYGPDIWVNYINGFIDRHREEPFFVYYSMALPHWPMVPTPDSPAWQDPQRRNEEDVRYFKDMAEYMDKCVGKIVQHVDEAGLAENTLILFFSDNGTHLKVTSQTRSGPVSGGKGKTTDAGTRVPLIARWPQHIQPGVSHDLIDSTDLLPTMMDAAGAPLPEHFPIDGRSFYPQLMGQPGTPREWIFCHFDPRPGWDKDRFRLQRFARTARYKLYADGSFFDVPADPLETKSIATGQGAPAAEAARALLKQVFPQIDQPLTPAVSPAAPQRNP